jgi:hypothetical protein
MTVPDSAVDDVSIPLVGSNEEADEPPDGSAFDPVAVDAWVSAVLVVEASGPEVTSGTETTTSWATTFASASFASTSSFETTGLLDTTESFVSASLAGGVELSLIPASFASPAVDELALPVAPPPSEPSDDDWPESSAMATPTCGPIGDRPISAALTPADAAPT